MTTLLKGDCLEVMKTLSDKSISLFICDLPYGCLSAKTISLDRTYRGGGIEKNTASGCPWDIKIDLVEFWKQVKRLCKDDNVPVLMFCTTKFGAELIASNPSWFRYDLVWSKSNGVGFLCANKQPLRSHEMIYVFSKKGAYYKRIDIEGNFVSYKNSDEYKTVMYGNRQLIHKSNGNGKRCVKSVVEIANKKEKNAHPTAKPIDLYTWLISRYSNEGDTILDPTAGSFRSCFAAKALNRKAIGIEMDTIFFWKGVQSLVGK